MTEETVAPIPIEPRYPRLLHVMRWFQHHYAVTLAVAAVIMAGVFAFDLLTSAEWIAGGFYLVPLALHRPHAAPHGRSSSPASWRSRSAPR